MTTGPMRARARSVAATVRSPWVLGAVAALLAACASAGVCILVMLLVWASGADLSPGDSARAGLLVWGTGHGVPATLGGVTYSVLPWGLAVIPLATLGYAGAWAARASRSSSIPALLRVLCSGVVTYVALAVIVAVLVRWPAASVSAVDAGVHALVFALVAFGTGAARACGLRPRDVLPEPVRVAMRGAIVSVLVLLGAGACAVAAVLVVRFDDAVTLMRSLGAGGWGGPALLLVCLAYLPVIIVWSTAYMVGAGVTLGSVVSPFIATSPGDLPAFPLFAAVPQTTAASAWALPVVGILAGGVAGLIVARYARRQPRLVRMAEALGATALSALALFMLSYLATGSLGDGRLAAIGPTPSTVAILVLVLGVLGSVPSAVIFPAGQTPTLTLVPRPGSTPPSDEEVDV